ncbi:MAG TPA: alpha/beta hydrolase [Stellaceae bacterium]|nr:alpha/beta hydrolase [Stellaceae bacterium]
MRRYHIAFALVVFSGFLSGPAPALAAATSTPGVRIEKGIHYGPLPPETYDACLPKGAGSPLPAVILIHGGTWQHGSAANLLSDGSCQFFAFHGIAAFAINYRLYHRRTRANRWPDQLVDAQLAVRFLRAQASLYNVDPNHICALGESAGGHLALFLGSLDTPVAGDEASLYFGVSPKVSCVVDDFGPSDLVAMAAIPGELVRYRALGQFFFGIPIADVTKAQWASVSPITYLSGNSAATLVVQGNADTTVPPSQSQEVYDTLQKDGVATTYVSYNGGHGFSGVSPTALRRIGRKQARFIKNN